MKKLEWRTEKRKVAELKPAKYNPRRLTDKQRADLTASVQEFGEVEPVVVNTNDTIIGGHQRIKIYADLGIKEIVVRVPNRKLILAEEKRLNLRLNKNQGEWDFELLRKIDIDTLLEIGFDEELAEVLDDVNELDSMDQDRMKAMVVYPPEMPMIKERAMIHCSSMPQYEKIKKAVLKGKISAEE